MHKIYVIAEAGVNHNGDIMIAKQLIDGACAAGADAVKFQTFNASRLVSVYAPKAEYQMKTTACEESQLSMLKKLELTEMMHRELISYCGHKGIIFLSTPFDLESIDFLCSLGLNIFKIPSGEITNLPYLRKIGSLKRDVILSTGMADLNEIGKALEILTGAGTAKDNITVLHCNTEYPTPVCDVNLHAMHTIRDTFGVKVGYSDHTNGIEIAIAAAALGAEVIEKHFTLDKNMKGPDHKASLNPEELRSMIRAIRNIEKALGDGIKKPSTSELKNKIIARKSIIALCSIKKGEIFTEQNITTKRPGTGLCPMEWDTLLGKKAKRDFSPDELIEL